MIRDLSHHCKPVPSLTFFHKRVNNFPWIGGWDLGIIIPIDLYLNHKTRFMSIILITMVHGYSKTSSTVVSPQRIAHGNFANSNLVHRRQLMAIQLIATQSTDHGSKNNARSQVTSSRSQSKSLRSQVTSPRIAGLVALSLSPIAQRKAC